MKTLLFSMILYLMGIAGVLFFRPHLMFHRDGRWKEFGIEEGTVFPFWLFCIVWAILSYVIARLAIGEPIVTSGVIANAVAASNILAEAPEPPSLNQALRNRNRRESGPETMKPGYYRLNTAALEKTGVPRYVYVGPEEPED